MVQFFGGFENAIYTQRETASGSDIHKTFDMRKLLNKKLKPDKESENQDNIVFLFEIITNSMYGKMCPHGTPPLEILF